MTAIAVRFFSVNSNSLSFGYKRFHISAYVVCRDKSTVVMQGIVLILVVNNFNSRDI